MVCYHVALDFAMRYFTMWHWALPCRASPWGGGGPFVGVHGCYYASTQHREKSRIETTSVIRENPIETTSEEHCPNGSVQNRKLARPKKFPGKFLDFKTLVKPNFGAKFAKRIRTYQILISVQRGLLLLVLAIFRRSRSEKFAFE